jgi:O-glycosyl hydrolase
MGAVKVWIDAAGHYNRPEVLQFKFDDKPLWSDEKGYGNFKPKSEDREEAESNSQH